MKALGTSSWLLNTIQSSCNTVCFKVLDSLCADVEGGSSDVGAGAPGIDHAPIQAGTHSEATGQTSATGGSSDVGAGAPGINHAPVRKVCVCLCA